MKKKKDECLPSNDDHSLVYASYSCTSDNAMSIASKGHPSSSFSSSSSSNLLNLSLPVLKKRFSECVIKAMDVKNAVCFFQPKYSMVDYTNTPVTWSKASKEGTESNSCLQGSYVRNTAQLNNNN